MAHGLSLRRTAAAALVIAVVVVHGWVANRVADLIAEFSAPQPMPPRIEVAFVREMQPSPPPVAAAPAPPPPRSRRERQVAGPAAPAAPAASAVPPEPAPPEPVREPEPELPAPVVAASVVAAAAASAPEPAASAAAFEWPASTRVSYVLTGNYRGEIHGSAQVEWVRVGLHYQVRLDVIVGLSFMPLLSRHMTSDGEVTPAGLFPLRYDEESKVAFGDRRRATMVFEPDAVVLANGQRRERWPGVQDTASQFVQLIYLFTNQPQLLTPGSVVEMPLALPRRVDRWVYDVLGAETLDTPFGHVEGVHLKPRPLARRGGELSAEIWFAPSLHYLPARIRIQQDDETYIDLMIKRRPQLAAQ